MSQSHKKCHGSLQQNIKDQDPVLHVVRRRQNRSSSHLNVWQQRSIITLKTNHTRPWHRILFNNSAWWEVSCQLGKFHHHRKVSTNLLLGHAYSMSTPMTPGAASFEHANGEHPPFAIRRSKALSASHLLLLCRVSTCSVRIRTCFALL